MDAKRVILDTNLLISFLISQKLDSIDNLLLQGKIILLFSNELMRNSLLLLPDLNLKNTFQTKIPENF